MKEKMQSPEQQGLKEQLRKAAKGLFLAAAVSMFSTGQAKAADSTIRMPEVDVMKTADEGMSKEERHERLAKVMPEFMAALEQIDPLLVDAANENPEQVMAAIEQAEETTNQIIVASNK